MDRGAALSQDVEEIARLFERRFFRSSPFHLVACSGCKGPSFQQPCLLCGHYPMGLQKLRPTPQCTRDTFVREIANSGQGAEGTLATWYIGSRTRTVAYQKDADYRQKLAVALDEAATLRCRTDPSDIYDLISVEGHGVHRQPISYPFSRLWRMLEELSDFRVQPFARPELARDIVAAIHSEDENCLQEAVGEIAEEARRQIQATRSSGNLFWVLSEAEAMLSPVHPHP